MSRLVFRGLMLAGLLALGCGSDGSGSGNPQASTGGAGGSGGATGGAIAIDPNAPALLGTDCDPLVPEVCGFPFPSDVYLTDDPSGLGKSIRFGKTTLPRFGPEVVDPALFHDIDGFSNGAGPMAFLLGADTEGLATPATIASTTANSSPTILMEAETGRLVPHWVDIDVSVRNQGLDGQPDERSFMIRPAELLKHGTRYIVAIRGVKNREGTAIEPSDAFQALRDGTDHRHPSVELRRDLCTDIFSKLDSAGVEKETLQLSWDYTTASKAGVTGNLVSLRDQALTEVGTEGPSFVVKSVEEAPNEHLLRRIIVTMTVPLYLTNGEEYDPSRAETAGRLNLDANGALVQNGTMSQDVSILVPKSIDGGQPHGLMQNGHGLFGRKGEGRNGFMARAANEYRYVVFSTDFYGFASPDEDLAILMLTGEAALLRSFVDRQHQGHVNQLLAMRMMMGRIAQNGIQDSGGADLLPAAAVDPAVRAYRGDSQGGIMGGAYMALSTDVTRGLLGEPGTPYNLLLNRSVDWPEFGFVLGVSSDSGTDVQLLLSLIQTVWDQTEPSGYVQYLGQDMLPGTPAHRVLLHAARGDHQVTTYAAHIMARALGAVNMQSGDGLVSRDIYGVENAGGPIDSGSVLVEYDFGLVEPLVNLPQEEGCDPHDRVRELEPSFQQQDEFFRTGTVRWFCDGVCNCDGPNEEVGCSESLAEIGCAE